MVRSVIAEPPGGNAGKKIWVELLRWSRGPLRHPRGSHWALTHGESAIAPRGFRALLQAHHLPQLLAQSLLELGIRLDVYPIAFEELPQLLRREVHRSLVEQPALPLRPGIRLRDLLPSPHSTQQVVPPRRLMRLPERKTNLPSRRACASPDTGSIESHRWSGRSDERSLESRGSAGVAWRRSRTASPPRTRGGR